MQWVGNTTFFHSKTRWKSLLMWGQYSNYKPCFRHWSVPTTKITEIISNTGRYTEVCKIWCISSISTDVDRWQILQVYYNKHASARAYSDIFIAIWHCFQICNLLVCNEHVIARHSSCNMVHWCVSDWQHRGVTNTEFNPSTSWTTTIGNVA